MKQNYNHILSILCSVLFAQQVAGQYNYCGPRNVMFLVDQSSSVNRLCLSKYDWEKCEEICQEMNQDVDTCTFDYFSTQKDFIKEAISNLDLSEERTNVGIMRFSSSDLIRYDVILGSWPSYDQEALQETIDTLPYEMGSTHTRLALEQAGSYILQANETYNDYGDEEWFIPVHNLIVVITDGSSNDGTANFGKDDPTPIAQYLRRQGVDIMTIGIGSSVNIDEMRMISGSSNLTHQVDSFDNLSEFTNVIYDDLCPKDILDPPPVILEPEKPKVTEPKPELTPIEEEEKKTMISNPNNLPINQNPDATKSDNTGAIVGAVIGSLFAVALIALGGFVWYRNKKKNDMAHSKLSDQMHGQNVLQNPLHDGEGQTSFIENRLYGRNIQ